MVERDDGRTRPNDAFCTEHKKIRSSRVAAWDAITCGTRHLTDQNLCCTFINSHADTLKSPNRALWWLSTNRPQPLPYTSQDFKQGPTESKTRSQNLSSKHVSQQDVTHMLLCWLHCALCTVVRWNKCVKISENMKVLHTHTQLQ